MVSRSSLESLLKVFRWSLHGLWIFRPPPRPPRSPPQRPSRTPRRPPSPPHGLQIVSRWSRGLQNHQNIKRLSRMHRFWNCPESILFFKTSIDDASILSWMADCPESMLLIRFLLRTYHFCARWLIVRNECFSVRFLLRICNSELDRSLSRINAFLWDF